MCVCESFYSILTVHVKLRDLGFLLWEAWYKVVFKIWLLTEYVKWVS